MIYDILSLCLILVIGWLTYWTIVFLHLKYKLWKIPGPLALPLLGNCYDPSVLAFLKYLRNVRKQYGKVYTFYNFTSAYVVLCDSTLVRRVLSDPKTFYKGEDYTSRFKYVFGEGLVTSIGEKHKRDRNVFTKYFVPNNIGKFSKQMNNILKKGIETYLLPHSNSGKSFNIEPFFARMAFRCFMNYALSTDLSELPDYEEKLCHSTSDGSNSMGRTILYNLPFWNIFPDIQRLNQFNQDFETLAYSVLAQRKEYLQIREEAQTKKGEDVPLPLDDCLTAMLEAKMSETEMIDHLKTFAAAGHDTTAYFTSYMMYLLAYHPEEQKKAYDIIVKYFEEKYHTKEIEEVTVTLDDLSALKHLQYIMMETARYFSIIPCLSRVAGEPLYIPDLNTTIPQGTPLLIPIVVLNRDDIVWKEPATFNPLRFEGKIDFTSAKDGYFPFAYGSRTCIGNNFARIVSGMILCHILLSFEILPDPSFKPQIQAGISLTTVNGIQVKLQPRKAKK